MLAPALSVYLPLQSDREAQRDLRMREGTARHGKHLAVDVFMFYFGGALKVEVLFGRKSRNGLRGHNFILVEKPATNTAGCFSYL